MSADISLFTSFENFLGASKKSEGFFSYDTLLDLDEKEEYPNEQCLQLYDWGLHQFFVPKTNGGRLVNLQDTFFLLRLLARRDLTTAIAFGGTFLGAVAVWIGGSEQLKAKVANDLLNRKKIAFSVTEKESGSDLMSVTAMGVFDTQRAAYKLEGQKWLYNHASMADFTTVLVKTDADAGPRSCSLLYSDMKYGGSGQQHTVKRGGRIKTVGLKGLDLGSVSYSSHVVPADQMIGRRGQGFELTLSGLQITKTICAGLAIGSFDCILRTCLDFCCHRKLYNDSIIKIPLVQTKLVESFLDLLISEACCTTILRLSHIRPQQLSLFSAVAKALIPSMVDANTKELSVVLGARSYLRNETDAAVFQKQARDNAIIPIFEGSTSINYQYIIQQLSLIFSSSLDQHETDDFYDAIYNLDIAIPEFCFEKLSIFGKGKDPLLNGLVFLINKLQSKEKSLLAQYPEVIKNLDSLLEELKSIQERYSSNKRDLRNPFTIESEDFQYAKKYASIHAISAFLNILYRNRAHISVDFSWQIIFRCALTRVVCQIKGTPFALSDADRASIIKNTIYCLDNQLLFSLFPFSIN